MARLTQVYIVMWHKLTLGCLILVNICLGQGPGKVLL